MEHHTLADIAIALALLYLRLLEGYHAAEASTAITETIVISAIHRHDPFAMPLYHCTSCALTSWLLCDFFLVANMRLNSITFRSIAPPFIFVPA